jgi:elongation factor P
MKEAQEFREGNVIKLNNEAFVILKIDYNKSGTGRRCTPVVKMKLRNLLNGNISEQVFKPDDKIELIILDKKPCQYSYFADPMYVFMDEEFNQYEIEKDLLGDLVKYIEDGMQEPCEVTFYEGKPISVELPITVIREVEYTEPAARGDTQGKVTKTARLTNGHELQVAAFIDIGDKIEIDTRTGEFKKRA